MAVAIYCAPTKGTRGRPRRGPLDGQPDGAGGRPGQHQLAVEGHEAEVERPGLDEHVGERLAQVDVDGRRRDRRSAADPVGQAGEAPSEPDPSSGC